MSTDPIDKLMAEFDAAVVADPIKQPHVRENFKATLEYELDALRAEVESLRADAERYRWLAPRLFAADFDYGGDGVSAVVFEWPNGASIGSDLDAAIDAARATKGQG